LACEVEGILHAASRLPRLRSENLVAQIGHCDGQQHCGNCNHHDQFDQRKTERPR
jgi:hypothetical protein